MKIFDILIWSIIAIVLVFLVITIFEQLIPKEDLLTSLKKSTTLAETNENMGKIISLNNKLVEENYLLSKTNFELTKRSMAFECNDPNICCNKGEKCNEIEWDEKKILFKKQTNLDFFIRCIEEKISVCKIYLGKTPAQSEVKNIELLSQKNNEINLKSIIKNNGENNLTFGTTELKLYKKVNGYWELTNESFEKQSIDFLLPQQEHDFFWKIDIKTIGEYKIEIVFKAENGGFDKNSIEILINKNNECKTSEKENVIIEENDEKKLLFYCENCNYAFECLNAWKEKKPSEDWQIYNKNSTYYIIN